jgi:isoquinoline 1-oxidoreductase beta subunit
VTSSSGGLTRRAFLQASAAAGGGLLLAACSSTNDAEPSPTRTGTASETPQPQAFQPNFWVRVDAGGEITLTIHRTEMGQGVRTALAMLLAEELMVDLDDVRIEQAPSNGETNQVTSGSGSVWINYQPLREAGAAAREMLITAAAMQWDVDRSACRAERGRVVRTGSEDSVGYGDLAALAATLEVPSDPPLTPVDRHRLIGASVPRVDGPAIVDGSAVYGIDVHLDGMLYASVLRCPVAGGTVKSVDDIAARAVPGVVDVVRLEHGVAVVARDSWSAQRGRIALRVEFDEGENVRWSSETISTHLADLAAAERSDDGIDLEGLTLLEATYETPPLAHAPIEPVNSTAWVRDDSCEIWSGTQNPQDVRDYVQSAVRVPTTVHVTLAGGGFGRRLEVDDAVEAALVSRAVGAPVQVLWTRADDLQHDFYRQPTHHWMQAGWTADGELRLWRHTIAAPGINGVAYQVGQEVLEEALRVPYGIRDQFSKPVVAYELRLPTGPWRSVMLGPNTLANESFFDEVAANMGRDPYELRMALLATDDPLRPVLERAATEAGWGSVPPSGRGRGIAAANIYERTPVAMVAEAGIDGGEVVVDRVVCAVECGLVINPAMVVQQMEGGIVFGLSSLLGEITYDRGRVVEANFTDYPIVRMRQMPTIEVHVVPSDREPQGVGEMAVPVVVPAVLNALYAATGARVRRAPVRPTGL